LGELLETTGAGNAAVEEFVRTAVEEKLTELRMVRYFRERGPWRCVPARRGRRRRSG